MWDVVVRQRNGVQTGSVLSQRTDPGRPRLADYAGQVPAPHYHDGTRVGEVGLLAGSGREMPCVLVQRGLST